MISPYLRHLAIKAAWGDNYASGLLRAYGQSSAEAIAKKLGRLLSKEPATITIPPGMDGPQWSDRERLLAIASNDENWSKASTAHTQREALK